MDTQSEPTTPKFPRHVARCGILYRIPFSRFARVHGIGSVCWMCYFNFQADNGMRIGRQIEFVGVYKATCFVLFALRSFRRARAHCRAHDTRSGQQPPVSPPPPFSRQSSVREPPCPRRPPSRIRALFRSFGRGRPGPRRPLLLSSELSLFAHA